MAARRPPPPTSPAPPAPPALPETEEGQKKAGKAKKEHWSKTDDLAFKGYVNMGKLDWLDKFPCESFDLDVKNKVLHESGH